MSMQEVFQLFHLHQSLFVYLYCLNDYINFEQIELDWNLDFHFKIARENHQDANYPINIIDFDYYYLSFLFIFLIILHVKRHHYQEYGMLLPSLVLDCLQLMDRMILEKRVDLALVCGVGRLSVLNPKLIYFSHLSRILAICSPIKPFTIHPKVLLQLHAYWSVLYIADLLFMQEFCYHTQVLLLWFLNHQLSFQKLYVILLFQFAGP